MEYSITMLIIPSKNSWFGEKSVIISLRLDFLRFFLKSLRESGFYIQSYWSSLSYVLISATLSHLIASSCINYVNRSFPRQV